MIIRAPLQADNVLHRRHALIHRLQLIETQALQARLHAFHAPGGERSNLSFLEIALGFDEHIEVAMVCRESTKEVLHIFQIDDVVHQAESRRIVAAGEMRHFPSHLLG